MESPAIAIALSVVLVTVEILFFAYCFRWLSQGKRLREKEFARLDSERGELLELQSALNLEMMEARKLSQETLGKLARVGADAHAEWNDMMAKVEAVLVDIEARTSVLMQENLATVSAQRLALEKSIQDGSHLEARLSETMERARKVLRFFDRNVPADQIVKDLQVEKYAEARRLIERGVDASAVSKKLGLSLSEVTLISHVR